MIAIRRADERGRSKTNWLDSRHTFSFADYYDTRHMGFRALRVLNDDRVRPGSGFGSHPHRDMEIISYVVSGALEHKDSMGNGSTIRPGEVQRMTAGTGVLHSEWNHSADEFVRFLQIWLIPQKEGLAPGYEQKAFDPRDLKDRLCLVVSQDGREGTVSVNQDFNLYAGKISAGSSVEYTRVADRHAWVQVVRGSIALNGVSMVEGDGASVSEQPSLHLEAAENAEVLVFDLA